MALRPAMPYKDNPADALIPSLISVYGTTTAAGNAIGTTFISSQLMGQPGYRGHAVAMVTGDAAGQARQIISHNLATGTCEVDRPWTDGAGAAYQIPANTHFIILSIGGGAGWGSSSFGGATGPQLPYLAETWQDELGIDFTVWQVINPATGVAWARGAAGAYLRANSIPNANETARLRSVQRWIAAPGIYGTNTIIRGLCLEFAFMLTNLANWDNTQSILGLTAGIADTRATNDIIGFGLVGVGNALQTVTDLAGAETVNTGFGEALTNWNKLMIRVTAGVVRFYLNEALVATHVTNLPDFPMYANFYCGTNAGGAAAINIGPVRVWHEDGA